MKTLPWLILPALLGAVFAAAAHAQAPALKVENTVVKQPLAEGVSMDDAVDSMKLRANMHNMKLVGELPLSRQIEAMGREARRMEIFQFCDPLTAQRMVEADIHYAAYLPCRIALVEDAQGRGWLVMMNLDMFLQNSDLPPDLHKEALRVRDALNDILAAGANGEL